MDPAPAFIEYSATPNWTLRARHWSAGRGRVRRVDPSVEQRRRSGVLDIGHGDVSPVSVSPRPQATRLPDWGIPFARTPHVGRLFSHLLYIWRSHCPLLTRQPYASLLSRYVYRAWHAMGERSSRCFRPLTRYARYDSYVYISRCFRPLTRYASSFNRVHSANDSSHLLILHRE